MKKGYLFLSFVSLLVLGSFANAEIVASVDTGSTTAFDGFFNNAEACLTPWGAWNATAELYQGINCRFFSGGFEFAQMTIPPNGGTLEVTYFDGSNLLAGTGDTPNLRLFIQAADGGTWEDVILGVISIDGTDTWQTAQIPISASVMEYYVAYQTCLDSTADAPWTCDIAPNVAGWQALIDASVAGSSNWGAYPNHLYISKIEMVDSKDWPLVVGNNADVNFAEREVMYITTDSYTNGSVAGTVETREGKTCRFFSDGTADNSAPAIIHTIDPDCTSISLEVYDDNTASATGFSVYIDNLDGGSWADVHLLDVILDQSGGWETTTVELPPEAFSVTDAVADNAFTITGQCAPYAWVRAGTQALIRFMEYDDPDAGPWMRGTALVGSITIGQEPVTAVEDWLQY